MQGHIKHGKIQIIQKTDILELFLGVDQSDVIQILSSSHEARLTPCAIYEFLHCLMFKNSSKRYSTHLVLSFTFY